MKRLLTNKSGLYLVLGILMFCMLCAPVLAKYDYNGSSLETIKSGIVKGDVYISSGDKSGFNNNNVSTYYTPHSLITNFTNVPKGDDIEWAELKVGVAGANTSRIGWVNTTLSGTGGEYALGQYELNVSVLPDNMDANVTCCGTGIYLINYTCTDQLKNINSNAITATVRTWPKTPTATIGLDCRIYGAYLIVVYKNGTCYTQYWINQGELNLHKEASVWVNGTFQSFTDFDANRTWFNGTAYKPCPLGNSTLTVGYLVGDANQKDYLHFNVPNAADSPYILSDPRWNITKYLGYQLGSNVANATNESGSMTNYSDLHTFGVKDLVNHTDDNYAILWRGHDSNNATIWDNSANLEVESYVSPFLEVLKTTRITTYDFSNDTAGRAGEDLFAYRYQNNSNPPIANNVPNIEFTAAQYNNIKADDGVFQTDVTNANSNYAAHRFVFNASCCTNASNFTAFNVTWNGRGWHDAGGSGAYLYIWNYASNSYELLATGIVSTEQTLSGQKTTNLGDYISNGNITVLVEQTSRQYTLGGVAYKSHISTDYVKLFLNPIT